MTEVVLTVKHKIGLHARPAAMLYRKAREFKSDITIQNLSRPGSPEVPLSTVYLMQIAVRQGHEIRLRASGEDADDAIAALSKLVSENFGEKPW